MSPSENITGLVLAGGRGSRMGGVDKGLQTFLGQTLAARSLERLAPGCARLMISANRNMDSYVALVQGLVRSRLPSGCEDVQIVEDEVGRSTEGLSFEGPLAGLHAGLTHCATDWLACVPCDAPFFPNDLVAQLYQAAVQAGADAAVACTGGRMQPVFLLVRRTLADSLSAFLSTGDRKVGKWLSTLTHVRVEFDAAQTAFTNVNTLDELFALETSTMSISMYTQSIPVFVRQLGNLSKIIEKAKAHAAERGFDPNAFMQSRLAPDMLPLPKQVQIACDFAKGAGARLTGTEAPKFDDSEATLDDLQARIEKTQAYLKSLNAAQFEGSEGRAVEMNIRGEKMEFKGLDYLNFMVLPNFYFHCTTLYNLFRQAGVPLGKRDFIGGA